MHSSIQNYTVQKSQIDGKFTSITRRETSSKYNQRQTKANYKLTNKQASAGISYKLINDHGHFLMIQMISKIVVIECHHNWIWKFFINPKPLFLQATTALMFLKIMDAYSLLVNNTDRLIVAWKPIFYFQHVNHVAIILLSAQYTLILCLATYSFAVTIASPTKMITVCV